MIPSTLPLLSVDDIGVKIFNEKWSEACSAKGDMYLLVAIQVEEHNKLIKVMNTLIADLRNRQ